MATVTDRNLPMFKKLRDAKALWKALDYFEKIKEQAEMETFKKLIVSKRLWVNVVGLALTVGGILPTEYGVPVLAVANYATKIIDTFWP